MRDEFDDRRRRAEPSWVATPTDRWSVVVPGQQHPSEHADLKAAADEWARQHRPGARRGKVYQSAASAQGSGYADDGPAGDPRPRSPGTPVSPATPARPGTPLPPAGASPAVGRART
ncbi:MAG TPA: hypothetical protein VES42_20970, partial [Pilimelia sp.]|nr:hypothetical protein [Pilimelia sp.]